MKRSTDRKAAHPRDLTGLEMRGHRVYENSKTRQNAQVVMRDRESTVRHGIRSPSAIV
jgi:hypothetical protein